MRAGLKLAALAPLALLLTGCAGFPTRSAPVEVFPDMDRQPKYRPEDKSAFFADGRTSRRPVAGTVSRQDSLEDDVLLTGAENGMYVGKNPVPLTKDVMALGQEKFNVYCTPCHDATGAGRGVVPVRTNWLPTNLQEDRVRAMVDGEIFHVLTNGRRNMPSYRFQITPKERWAIVYYVRALQRASRTTPSDVPAGAQAQLKEAQ